MIRALVWLLGGLLLTLGVLLLGGYAFFPQLAGWLGPVFVQSSSIQVLEVVAERPGLREIRISRLRVAGDEFTLSGNGLELRYGFSRLIQAQFDSLRMERLDVEYRSAGSSEDAVAAPDKGKVDPMSLPDLESFFSTMPFDEVSVTALNLRLPELAVVASGELLIDRQGLRGSLKASEPEAYRDFLVDLVLDRSGEIHGVFGRTQTPDAPFLSVHSRIPDDRLNLDAQVHLEGANLDLAAYLLDLPEGQGRVDGRFEIAQPWPIDLPEMIEEATVHGRASVDWVSADRQIDLSGLDGPLSLAGGLLAWTLPQPSETEGARISWRSGAATVDFAPTELQVSLSEQRLAGEGALEARIDDGEGTATTSVSFTGTGTLSGRIDAAATDLQVELGGSLMALDREFPLQLGATARLTDILLADLELTSGIVRKLGARVRYTLAGGAWTLNASHEQSISEPLINALWPGWRQPFDLEGGKIELALMLGGQDAADITGSLQVELRDVAGFYQNTVVRGLNGQLEGRLQSGHMEILPSPIRIRVLDFGVPVSAIETQLSGNPDQVKVGETRGELLGGRFLLQPFEYAPASGAGELRLVLDGLDLAAVLALEGDDITGSGRLDGVIPISIRENQVTVTDGELQARAPGGSIHLSTAVAGALSQPGLDVALGALTDFQYEVLTGRANYSELGDLELGIRLEGRSSLVEKGRPIHFNLNVSENIPVLLESLRLQDEFTKRIERKVQR